MLFARTTFVGIDLTGGRLPYVYAAMDAERQLLALSQGQLEEVLAFLAGQESAFVAVNAPRSPNQGAMARDEVRESLSPVPRPGRWLDYRVCEYTLRQRNIAVIPTPAREASCSSWVRKGFHLYQKLEALGYRPYPGGEDIPLQVLETNPHAGNTVLLGQAPFQKFSLEGRLQRQLVLYEKEVAVPDPLRFFEEVTRHRLLKGILPLEGVYEAVELDALLAAYTAYLAGAHPEQTTRLGCDEEGYLVLPGGELKERY
jgi:hypothetical protein